MSFRLDCCEPAPGLLYEANGDGGGRYISAADGDSGILDLLIDRQYATEQAVESQPARTLGPLGPRFAQRRRDSLE